ncbi:MAG: glycosyltransferase family 4 protein, partial [Muribaculum sp.]|nr:glycosyltransferase family 4 protein [Muribaculum sp.]
MNVTLYLDNKKGTSVDARNLLKSNPGVGGTQYCILLLAYYLNLKPEYNISVLSVRDYILPNGIKFHHIEGDNDVVNTAQQLHTDVLILKHFPGSILERTISESNLKVIVWSHNFLYADFCRYIVRTPQIKCNVFVGRQQYDAYADDDVINKSIHIPNMVPVGEDELDTLALSKPSGHKVVFMGALCEKKGFLEMCRIWPGIIRDIPDAELIVIGNGKLYGETQLGKYGLASESFEKKFIPYITDKEGKIFPSVKFMGVVGAEKNEIFRTASVGVVNPSRSRETFGMAILEMNACGLPVATIAKTGYYDTVSVGVNGCLAKSLKSLQRTIVNMLNSNNVWGGVTSAVMKFSPFQLVPQWEQLLNDIYNDKSVIPAHTFVKPYSDCL